MSSLQGYISVSYDRLVETLGEPTYRNGDKTSCEWVLKVNGEEICVYDYKWECTQDDRIFDFHVGGYRPEAVQVLKRLVSFADESEAVERAEGFYGPGTWCVIENEVGLYEIQRPVVVRD